MENSGACSRWSFVSLEQAHLQIPGNGGFQGLRVVPLTYCRCQVECGAKEIRGSGLGELASQSWGLSAHRGGWYSASSCCTLGASSWLVLTPFPGDQPKCIGWGAGGESWWALADSHLGVPLSVFLYRPQTFLLLNILESRLPQKSTGGRFAFETGLGEVGWRRCLCGFLMSL